MQFGRGWDDALIHSFKLKEVTLTALCLVNRVCRWRSVSAITNTTDTDMMPHCLYCVLRRWRCSASGAEFMAFMMFLRRFIFFSSLNYSDIHAPTSPIVPEQTTRTKTLTRVKKELDVFVSLHCCTWISKKGWNKRGTWLGNKQEAFNSTIFTTTVNQHSRISHGETGIQKNKK